MSRGLPSSRTFALPLLGAGLLGALALAACGNSVNASGGTTSATGSTSAGAGGAAGSGVGTTTGVGGAAGKTGGSTGTGASTTTTGSGGSGGSFPVGLPISAPDDTWTWVPFADAFCANGTSTGIGVNLTSKSKDVLFFFQGGGACWSDLTCYLVGTASNITSGYHEADFMSEISQLGTGTYFDRSDTSNPMKDYNFIYIPYCTGDVHGGHNPNADYGNGTKTHHVGGENFLAYLARITPTFPDANHLVVSGVSAGGFGAGFNFWRVREAFPAAPQVDLLDDSGPPLPAPALDPGLANTFRTAWNLDPSFPPGCAKCLTTFDAILPYYGSTYPKSRFGLVSYIHDTVIPQFFGISDAQFGMGLQAMVTQDLTYPNMHYFFDSGTGHVVSQDPTIVQSGTSLWTWVTELVSGDPKWGDVHP